MKLVYLFHLAVNVIYLLHMFMQCLRNVYVIYIPGIQNL